MNTIAREIKKLREQSGLTASGLAEKSDLSPAYISKLEDGQYKSLSLTTCKSLARGFGISLRDFLESINFLENNKNRPSSEMISKSLRANGYTSSEIVKIMEYADFLRKTNE
jgi:transcriptional regulator with XRE-family HTH domain